MGAMRRAAFILLVVAGVVAALLLRRRPEVAIAGRGDGGLFVPSKIVEAREDLTGAIVARSSSFPNRGTRTSRSDSDDVGSFEPSASVRSRALDDPRTPRSAWDIGWIDRLSGAVPGDPVDLTLPGNVAARGRIQRVVRDAGRVTGIDGILTAPEPGHFFVYAQRKSETEGADSFFGVWELPASALAYRIEPTGPAGAPEVVRRALGEVRCVGLPPPSLSDPRQASHRARAAEAAFPDPDAPLDRDGMPMLESLPGADAVIFLDFRGGRTEAWGGIEFGAPDFDHAEMHEIWARVAEDFRPFQLNVVTHAGAFQRASALRRQRAIITPTDRASPGAGGVAYMGSFKAAEDIPCWVFVTNNVRFCAEALSHELGHTLGLAHVGTLIDGTSSEYYSGHGDGETGWAPLMGIPYYRQVTQWSRGEYADANRHQDQIRALATQNGLTYRVDDAADSGAGTRPLEIFPDERCDTLGVIETSGDVDAYVFDSEGGRVHLVATPAWPGPNLALRLELVNAGGSRVATEAASDTLGASLATEVPAGTYLLRVIGAGRGDPLRDGFSDYGSLGAYRVTGTVARARVSDRFALAENSPAGTVVGVVTPRELGVANREFRIVRGDSGGTFAIGPDGAITVVRPAVLDFESLAGGAATGARFDLLVAILDPVLGASSEPDRRVVIEVVDVPEPPSLRRVSGGAGSFTCLSTNCEFALSVIERTPPGTVIATLKADDRDRLSVLSYSIDGGEGVPFRVDEVTGEIAITGELIAAERHRYELVARVSDRTRPTALSATARVVVTIELPLPRGSIAVAMYPDIPGATLAALLEAPSYPRDPASEGRLRQFDVPALSAWNNEVPVGARGHDVGGVQNAILPASEFAMPAGGGDWDAIGSSSLDFGGSFGGFVPWPGDLSRPTNHFGMVVRGYLLPPATGDYTFSLASAGEAELWISDSTNVANLVRVARVDSAGALPGPREWSRQASQRSTPVTLAAGHAYAVEALAKVDLGTGHLAVAWECAACGLPFEVIPGRSLAPRAINYRPKVEGFEAAVHEDAFPGSRVGVVTALDLNATDRAAFVMERGNEDGLFDLDASTGEVRLRRELPPAGVAPVRHVLEIRVTDDGDPALEAYATGVVTRLPRSAMGTVALHHEVWMPLTNGSSVDALTSLDRFPGRPDQLRAFTELAMGGFVVGQSWGSRTRALLVPEATGLHSFYLASQGEARLKFAFDGIADHASIIAWDGGGSGPLEWTRTASQASGGQWLVAGQSYYLEVLARSGAGLGRVEVGWTRPEAAGTNLIPAAVLRSVDLGQAPVIDWAPVLVNAAASNGTEVVVLRAADSPIEQITFRVVGGSAAGWIAVDPVSGRATVADAGALAVQVGNTLDLRVQVQDSGYEDRFPRRVAEGVLALRVIDATPAALWVGRGDDTLWSTAANWNAEEPIDGGRLAFGGIGHRTSHNDRLHRAGLIQFLSGGFRVQGNPLTLMAGLAGNGDTTWALETRLGAAQWFTNFSGTFTWSGALDNAGHALRLHVNRAFRLNGTLSGGGSLSLAGGGRLHLGAAAHHSGPTRVENGELVVEAGASLDETPEIFLGSPGTLDVRALAGAFIVGPGQTLRGAGKVLGGVRVEGRLIPESSSTLDPLTFSNRLDLPGQIVVTFSNTLDSLNFSNRLALAGQLVLTARRSVGSVRQAPLEVAGELECGGHLEVRLAEPLPRLTAGDVYPLFRAAQLSGAFRSVALPSLPAGLRWDTGALGTDGSLRVELDPPRWLSVQRVGGAVALRFQSVTGYSYLIESAPNLLPDTAWAVVATRVGSGGIQTVQLAAPPGGTERFFRIRIRIP